MQDPNCIFCKIAAGTLPAKILMQNEKAMALLDAFPLTLGHTLVISKSHFAKVQDMDRDNAISMFEIVWQIIGAVEAGSYTNASIIAIHNGREAGQEIPHVHVHIVPRKRSDGAGAIHSMFKSKPKPDLKELDALATEIIRKLS